MDKERKRGKENDMKLVSKPNVMSLSGVTYIYVSKRSLNQTHRTFSKWNLVNKSTYFILRKKTVYLCAYLFIYENVAINLIINIELNFFLEHFLRFYLISI